MVRKYPSKRSGFPRFNLYFCHVYRRILISSKRLYQGLKSSLTRFADADSSANWELEIPEYGVTAPHPNREGYWGNSYSPWGDIPTIDTNIEGNIARHSLFFKHGKEII